MKRFSAFLVGLLMIVGSASAASTGTRQEAAVQSLADEVIILLRDSDMQKAPRQEGLRNIFTKYLDLPFIGRFVLGRYWRPLDEPTRNRYGQAFESYVVNIYAKRLDGYSGETMKVTRSRAISDKDVAVTSELQRVGGPPVSLEWRVRQEGDNSRIIDVVVGGVSMVISQREEFSTFLQNKSIDALIARLEQDSAK